MAAFKDAFDGPACAGLARAYGLGPDFVEAASKPLAGLELKARVAHVADTLRAWLDPDWSRAVEQLLAGLPPALEDTTGLDLGMVWWSACSVVERHGVEEPVPSLRALPELTKRFSGEMAIRPLLRAHPELSWEAVNRWAGDENPHVRRLASEGTRPRLPWGGHLKHPPAWSLLDRLVDDPELYVRRSVANHLGDLAKEHPAESVEHAAMWLKKPTEERRWVVRHGLRHLVKKGHEGALALQGYSAPDIEGASFGVRPAVVTFPGSVSFSLTGELPKAQALVVDLVVHFVTQRGPSPKTWKWSTKSHPAGPLALQRRYTLKPISTRRFLPGEHKVDLQVNGHVLASTSFELVIP